MNLKDRFMDYCKTDLAQEDYKHNITVPEQILYGILGLIIFVIPMIVLVGTSPMWCIPYLSYKSWKLKNKK